MRLASVADAGAIIRGRRMDMGMSQDALASRSGVSRSWINEVEAGKSTAEIGLVLRMFDVLGLEAEVSVAGRFGSDESR